MDKSWNLSLALVSHDDSAAMEFPFVHQRKRKRLTVQNRRSANVHDARKFLFLLPSCRLSGQKERKRKERRGEERKEKKGKGGGEKKGLLMAGIAAYKGNERDGTMGRLARCNLMQHRGMASVQPHIGGTKQTNKKACCSS